MTLAPGTGWEKSEELGWKEPSRELEEEEIEAWRPVCSTELSGPISSWRCSEQRSLGTKQEGEEAAGGMSRLNVSELLPKDECGSTAAGLGQTCGTPAVGLSRDQNLGSDGLSLIRKGWGCFGSGRAHWTQHCSRHWAPTQTTTQAMLSFCSKPRSPSIGRAKA